MLKLYFDGEIPNYILLIIHKFNFLMVSFNECDYVISCKFDDGIDSLKIIQDNLNFYKNINKKIIVFLKSDVSDHLDISYNILLFRTSIFKIEKKINEYLLPYIWIKNINNHDKEILENLPVIGFMGEVEQYREKIIRILQSNNNIKTNFKIIDQLSEVEFMNEMESSDFIICNKEKGNYSIMFYQVLSFGKIPILLNSDFILPFEDEINWNELIIIDNDEENIIKKILDWWETKDIKNIQKKCREIFEKYFTINNFSKILFNDINNKFIDLDMDVYNKYEDLKKLSYSDLLYHYVNHGLKEGRICKLPNNFNLNHYRIINNDLSHLNYDQLITHYIYYLDKYFF